MLDPVIEQIVMFLKEIGLSVRLLPIAEETFLPGVCLEPSGLIVDLEALRYPGDLLHEAGHLAVMLPAQRAVTTANAGSDMGDEMAAQCWSFAAAMYLGIPPEVVFHSDGYKGAAKSLITAFGNGSAGVPLLQWMGLTLDTKSAAEAGAEPYPKMVRWLRE